MSGPTLAVNGVQQRFGARVALDIDSLTIGPGVTAVLGRNGSGKSTLARLLASVWSPDVGTISFEGRSLADPDRRLQMRRTLGYVAQEDGLPMRMRVADYCDYVGVLKEIGPARTRWRWTHWALSQVGLLGRAGDRIKTLSGGMQRRLAIAQSLLGGPGLLILDEPDISLDPEQRAAVIELIAARGAAATTVASTHHPDELGAACDRVLVLDAGRLVFDGTPRALAHHGDGTSVDSGFRAVLPR